MSKVCKKQYQNRKVKSLFPLNTSKHGMKMRKVEKYETNKQNTNRLKKSALPYMRKLLNEEYNRKQKIIESIHSL